MLTTAKLAAALGVRYSRVGTARQRIARAGHWSCPIQWVSCRVLGELMASGPPRHDRTMHRARARLSEVERNRRAGDVASDPPGPGPPKQGSGTGQAPSAWPTLPPEVSAERMARLNAADARDQPLTQRQARQHGRFWSAEENAVVIDQGLPTRGVELVERQVTRQGLLKSGLEEGDEEGGTVTFPVVIPVLVFDGGLRACANRQRSRSYGADNTPVAGGR
ncbi:MAG: hypothetical protein M3442_16670 [Chloroflexota bacterium]|nr:hypothetical protein [Chloroflexota bacterium]